MPQIGKINGERGASRIICLPVRDMVLNDKVDWRFSQALNGLGGDLRFVFSVCETELCVLVAFSHSETQSSQHWNVLVLKVIRTPSQPEWENWLYLMPGKKVKYIWKPEYILPVSQLIKTNNKWINRNSVERWGMCYTVFDDWLYAHGIPFFFFRLTFPFVS